MAWPNKYTLPMMTVKEKAERIAAVECGPVAMDQRRVDFLAAIFECEHGIEMCESCTAKGRTCAHRCVECGPEQIFQEVR